MSMETVTIELVLPTLQNLPWTEIEGAARKMLAFTGFIALISLSAKTYFFKKMEKVEEEEPVLAGLVTVSAVLAIPAVIANVMIAEYTDMAVVQKQRLEELEEKAEALDELYEVGNK